MTHSLTRILIAASSVLILSGLATASPKADLDQDGRISKAEFVTDAANRFISTDINADGIITEAERDAAKDAKRVEKRAELFTRMDGNGDGVITQDEFNSSADMLQERRFERRDINGDGSVDRGDRKARMEKFKDKRAERGMRGDRGAGFEGRMDDGERKRRGRMGLRPDANEDGVVTRAEHDAAIESMFEKLDANGDGYLEKGEGPKKRKRFGFGRR